MNTIQIPLDEYQFMQEELILLRNTELLAKMNRLIDLLFQEKYGLFMQDYTEDLTEYSMNNAWRKEDTNAWDNL
jgi:chloramphenicol O-acetyltransferase